MIRIRVLVLLASAWRWKWFFLICAVFAAGFAYDAMHGRDIGGWPMP